MIARYLGIPALLLVLVAGCDSGTTTTPTPNPGSTPPVGATNAGGNAKKPGVTTAPASTSVRPIE
jgi:hypothetical protein